MSRISLLLKSVLFVSVVNFPTDPGLAQTGSSLNSNLPDFRNFYGITWRGTAHDNLAYAKQMGYEYVFYQSGMEKDSLSNDLYFYLETPEHFLYDVIINTNKIYSADEIGFYETYCALKNSDSPFPYNLATGTRWLPDTTKFVVLPDFQQQKVISWAIDGILAYARKIELRNPRFHFGGYAWDEPRPSGDFWEAHNGRLIPVSLKNWNGGDSFTAKAKNLIHNYPSYTQGHMEFFKQLFKSTHLLYPNARFISEPYRIYKGWVELIEGRPDSKEISPDILSQEGPYADFVEDVRIFASGLIRKENVYCTTPDVFDDEGNRMLMAKAALNGAGFGWFGRFGGTGNMPNFKNVTEVPPRLKLIRMLANWENRNGTPIAHRQWNGSIYQSENAYASPNVISALQPKTKKLFVVFLKLEGALPIPRGKRIGSISRTNDLFIENNDGTEDFEVNRTSIRPKDISCLNRGYIIQLN